jgi:hypothetical protein
MIAFERPCPASCHFCMSLPSVLFQCPCVTDTCCALLISCDQAPLVGEWQRLSRQQMELEALAGYVYVTANSS